MTERGPVFHFDRMEDLLRGRTVRGVRVDGIDAVFVNDPAAVRTILVKDSRNYGKGDLFRKGRNITTAGLLADDESIHRHYRRLANPFLRVTKVDEYVPGMRGIAEGMVASWSEGRPVDVQVDMCRVAGAIALGALFPGLPPGPFALLSEAVAQLTWATIRSPLYGGAVAGGRPAPGVAAARADFRRLLGAHLDELLRHSPDPAAGYLSTLLADTDEEGTRRLTIAQLCDEAHMMLTAATVTTASVMSWSLHVLSEQPAIEERLLADLAGGGGLGIDHRAPGYTVRFLMEILRVYPPVWIACRKTRSDAVLAGREVPAGVNVVLSSYLLHRDPDRYPEPDRFDPDRWRTVRPGITEEAAYIPFGLGPKGCIGEPFAWQELVVILDTITRTWRMRTAPGVTVRPAAETTLHPDRLPMIPRPR